MMPNGGCSRRAAVIRDETTPDPFSAGAVLQPLLGLSLRESVSGFLSLSRDPDLTPFLVAGSYPAKVSVRPQMQGRAVQGGPRAVRYSRGRPPNTRGASRPGGAWPPACAV